MLHESMRGSCAVLLTMTNHEQHPNCIVLVDEHQREVAQNVLSKHNLNGMLLHDPILAMSELCLLHQLRLQDTAWKESTPDISFVLIQVERTDPINQLIQAIQKYFPHISIVELREGQLAPVELNEDVVDKLDIPVVETDAIDADELSMLLEGINKHRGEDL